MWIASWSWLNQQFIVNHDTVIGPYSIVYNYTYLYKLYKSLNSMSETMCFSCNFGKHSTAPHPSLHSSLNHLPLNTYTLPQHRMECLDSSSSPPVNQHCQVAPPNQTVSPVFSNKESIMYKNKSWQLENMHDKKDKIESEKQ